MLFALCVCVALGGPWATAGAQESDDAVSQEASDESSEEATEESEAGRPDARMLLLTAMGIDEGMSDIVTSRIDSSIRERMGSVGGVELLPSFRALHGQAGEDATQEALAEAERDYTSAIGLVNAGQYDEAADLLRRSVTILEENVGELQNFNILVDALAYLAIAHHHTGFDLDARDNIRQYAYLVPEDSPRLEDFPDELAESYLEEAQRVIDAGPGTLEVLADREGAEIVLNGESVGRTPAEVEEVGFGEHYLVLRDGEDLWSDKVRVRGRGEATTVEVEMGGAEDGSEEDELPSFYVDMRETLESGVFDQGLIPYFDEVASQSGAEYVAWTLVRGDEGGYAVYPFVYRHEDGAVIQGEKVVFNRQLTNLRSRAFELSDTMAVAVVHMPDSMMVESVELIDEEAEPMEPTEVAEGDLEETEVEEESTFADPSDEQRGMVPSEEEEEEVAEAPEPEPEPEEERGLGDPGPMIDEDEGGWSRRRYLGIGGVAAGVTVGTLMFLMRGSDGATGFEAEVEW